MTKDEAKKSKSKAHSHKKVFDVTRPGKAPASPTSRPVITGHKPPVQDDQFVPGTAPLRASDPSEKHDLLDAKQKKDVQPTSSVGAAVSDKPTASVAAAEPAEPTSAPPLPQTGAKAVAAEPTPTVVAPTPEPKLAPQETQQPQIASAPELAKEASVDNRRPVAELLKEAEAAEKAEASKPVPPVVPGKVSGPWEPVEEDSPGHIALSHTVEQEESNPSQPPAAASSAAQTSATAPPHSGKTIDDLLAETGAPKLEPESSPGLIISHHKPHRKRHGWAIFVWFLIILLLAAIAFNILLDMEVVSLSTDIPHTDFFK